MNSIYKKKPRGVLSRAWQTIIKTNERIQSVADALKNEVPTLLQSAWNLQKSPLRFDRLTGVFNRDTILSVVEKNITKALRKPDFAFCLGFLDGAGFKEVNDKYGHVKGDELLKTLADRLRTHIRPYDHVGRLGGDEFVLVIDHDSLPAVASHAEKWNAEWKKPDNDPAKVTPFDIGWILISEQTLNTLLPDLDLDKVPTKDLTTLIVHMSDLVMYRAKMQRKGLNEAVQEERTAQKLDYIEELREVLKETYPSSRPGNGLDLAA